MRYEFWVYIMASLTGTLYIGMTNDIQRRAWEHKNGAIEGFSKKYGCSRLVLLEQFSDVRNAIAREKELKGWTRKKKIALIEAENPRWQDLAASWGNPMALPGETMKEVDERLANMWHPAGKVGTRS
jgi:putative endonuclease